MLQANAQYEHFAANYNSGLSALPYELLPNDNGDNTFNSNSFAAGLLQAAGLPVPSMTNNSDPRSRYPGWTKPLPAFFFGVVP